MTLPQKGLLFKIAPQSFSVPLPCLIFLHYSYFSYLFFCLLSIVPLKGKLQEALSGSLLLLHKNQNRLSVCICSMNVSGFVPSLQCELSLPCEYILSSQLDCKFLEGNDHVSPLLHSTSFPYCPSSKQNKTEQNHKRHSIMPQSVQFLAHSGY